VSVIVGYFDLKKQLPSETLATMLEASYVVSGTKVSFQEPWGGLGVISQLSDKQSVYECDGSTIGLVGEFESDCALPRLDTMDDAQIALLRGGFIWAQMNVAQQRFLIVNDHFARHPLYVVAYKDAILFATQIKALLAALPVKPELDKAAVAMMLSIGELVGNQTLVSGVETLAAGSVLELSANGKTQHQYWQYRYQQDFSINKKDAIESIGEALSQSVQRATAGCETATVPLSGGLDSRFILGLANQKKSVHAYTWGVADCRDLIYAKKTAEKIQCEHDFFEFLGDYLQQYADEGVWITEGQLPVVNFHVLPYVNRLAEDGHLTLLDGFAGDAILGGNFIKPMWFNNIDQTDVANKLWSWRLNGTLKHLQSDSLSVMARESKDLFSDVYAQYQSETSMDSVMSFLMDNRVRRVTTGGTEIFRTQFAVKQPFMDVDLITAINCVPHAWRKRHRLYLQVLKEFAPDVAAVAWQRTCLPTTVPYALSWASLAAQKGYKEARKYLPLPDLLGNDSPSQFSEWFRFELKDYVFSVLFSERAYDRHVLSMDALEEAWDKHQAGEIDAAAFLGAAMSIELFARLFLDDLDSSIQRFSGET